jgi:hypothetical protein
MISSLSEAALFCELENLQMIKCHKWARIDPYFRICVNYYNINSKSQFWPKEVGVHSDLARHA